MISPLVFASVVLGETLEVYADYREVDAIRLADDEHELDLSEVMAGAAAQQGISLPDDDLFLYEYLVKYGKPVQAMAAGVVGFDVNGFPSLCVGFGRCVDSTGDEVVQVDGVPRERFVSLWRLPRFNYLGSGKA